MAPPSDPRSRFSGRVDAYVRTRPGYPSGLVPVLARRIGLVPGWVVADVGSGTGLSSDPFLAHGNAVVAVEPNAEMRLAAERRLSGHAGFRSVAGSAEATGLADGSVDLVVAGQAFHWFDPDAARIELRRILRAPAPVALVWNTRRTDTSAFLRAFESLLLRHGTDYAEVRHDRGRGDALARFFGGVPTRDALPSAQVLDLPGLEGRLLSSSYTPPEGDPRRGPMLAELSRTFRDHAEAGVVRIDYETEVYTGFLAPGE